MDVTLNPASSDPRINGSPLAAAGTQAVTDAAAASRPAVGQLASDQATLSDRARTLGKARAEFDRTASAQSDRVSQLRAQVQTGTYRVDDDALARALLPVVK